MNNSVKLFDDELTNWLIDEAGLKQSKFQSSVYYKYATDGSKLVGFYYVDECLYWYASRQLGKCFMDKPGKILHVIFL